MGEDAAEEKGEEGVGGEKDTTLIKKMVTGIITIEIEVVDVAGAVAIEITLWYDIQQLAQSTRTTVALYLSCGVNDTSKAAMFVQSHVCVHVELMWLLSAATPIGRLSRKIKFKEKLRKVVLCSCTTASPLLLYVEKCCHHMFSG